MVDFSGIADKFRELQSLLDFGKARPYVDFLRTGDSSGQLVQLSLPLSGDSLQLTSEAIDSADETFELVVGKSFRRSYHNGLSQYGPIMFLDRLIYATVTKGIDFFGKLPPFSWIGGLASNNWIKQLFFPNARELPGVKTLFDAADSQNQGWFGRVKDWFGGLNPLNPNNTYIPPKAEVLQVSFDTAGDLLNTTGPLEFLRRLLGSGDRWKLAGREVGDFLTSGKLSEALTSTGMETAKKAGWFGKSMGVMGGFLKRFMLPVGMVTAVATWVSYHMPLINKIPFLRDILGIASNTLIADGMQAAIARNDVGGMIGKLIQGTLTTAIGVSLFALAGAFLPALLLQLGVAGILGAVVSAAIPAIGTGVVTGMIFPRSEEQKKSDHLASIDPGLDHGIKKWNKSVQGLTTVST